MLRGGFSRREASTRSFDEQQLRFAGGCLIRILTLAGLFSAFARRLGAWGSSPSVLGFWRGTSIITL
jgi:hypothetical protein